MSSCAYVLACIGIALFTRPWRGEEGALLFGVLINVISMPSGLIPTISLSALTEAVAGTEYHQMISTSPFWWLFLVAGCALFGWLQWFIIMPWVMRRLGVLTNHWSGP
jgi:hypothetical protein